MNELRKEQPEAQEVPAQPARKRGAWKKLFKGKGRKILALVLVVAVAAGFLAYRNRGSQQEASAQTTYTTAEVSTRDISNALSSSGTLEPANSYTVKTLVSAEILSDTFEEGDDVEKGQLLYTLDSSDAATSQTQAQNSYNQAVEAKYPTADMSGTVSEVYVQNGDSVNAGTELLKIVGDNNIYIDFQFSYADPSNFYVGQSATIYISGFAGTTQGTVQQVSTSTSASSNAAGSDRQMTTVRVQAANPGLVTSDYTASAVIGNYTSYGQTSIKVGATSVVTAETSGKISDFSYLVGDTVQSGDCVCTITGDSIEGGSTGTLCTIYDLSYLEMTMNIDELDISQVEVGQTVEITADAVEGKTYAGAVTKVSVAGTTSGGITTYPVTVRIDETDGLLPGMNVDAEIVIEEKDGVLAVPSGAVNRGDTVLITSDSPSASNALDQEAPEGYVYVQVETGVSDDSYTEILSGLQEGDTVAYIAVSGGSNSMGMMMPGGGMPSGGGMPGGGGGMGGGPGGGF